jgi:hypothetical protein
MQTGIKQAIAGGGVFLCMALMVAGAFKIHSGFGMIALGAFGIFMLIDLAMD